MTREEIKDFCDMKAQLEPENEDIYKAIVKTLQEPRKGHWVYKEFDERTGCTNVYICSKCGYPLASPYKSFCAKCGSDNREVESEDKE